MVASGRTIDQKYLEDGIRNASDDLDLPSGTGLRVHIDSEGAPLFLLLPYAKKLMSVLAESIKGGGIDISVGAKMYPPKKGDKENPKIWINLYKRVK